MSHLYIAALFVLAALWGLVRDRWGQPGEGLLAAREGG
jgi:hypothetical protein